MGGAMIDLAVLAILIVIALGVGRRLLHGLPFGSPLEEALFALALAFGLLAYATLALGEAGLLRAPALVAVLGAGAFYGWREAVAALARAGRAFRRATRRDAPWTPIAGIALASLVIGAELIPLFAPPIGGDQTKYQLVYPRLWAEAHRIVPTPWSFWGYLQFLMNMLFTAAFVLRGDVLARLLNAAYGVLVVLAVYAAGRRLFSARVGGWAAMLFVTMPLTATLMIRAWVEFALALYVLLALVAVLAWREEGAWRWLALAAVMAGFAAATKLMGLLVPALLGVVVLAELLRRRTGAWRAVATTVAFGVLAAIVASPCYLRNAVETGNPTFPFGYAVFDGRDWSADAAAGLDGYYAAYRETQAAKRGGHAYRSWREALRFPWDATMAPYSFEESGRSAYDPGPFILAFAPGLLLLGRAPRAWIVAGFAVAYAAVVVFAMWAHPRYVHPALPLLLLVAVAAVERNRRRGAASAAVTAVLAATVLGQAVLAARVIAPRWLESAQVAVGRTSGETFLRRHEPRWALASLVRREVPQAGKVVILGMIPHPYYYVGRPFVLASPLEQNAIDYRRLASVDELLAALRDLGVTHAVREADPEKEAVNPIGAHVLELWDGLLARSSEIGVVAAGALYRLPEPTPARADVAFGGGRA
jgi:4-amino-4-deoxy-L-arabinose transferase-like glycosyltransferase